MTLLPLPEGVTTVRVVLPVERPGAKIATHDLAVVGRAVLGGGQAGHDGDRGREEDQLVHGCTSAATERLLESTVRQASARLGRTEIMRQMI